MIKPTCVDWSGLCKYQVEKVSKGKVEKLSVTLPLSISFDICLSSS